MKAIICSSCGASRWKEDGRYRICLHCGTYYEKTPEEKVRSAVYAVREGAVRKSDSVIALNDDVERLLQKCRSDPRNARKYANLVLDIDPTNQEALFILNNRRR